MLLQDINQHISKNDFTGAFKTLKRYMAKGGLFNSSNDALIARRNAFHKKYKDYFEDATTEQVQDMAIALQQLADNVEKNLVVKPFSLLNTSRVFLGTLFTMLLWLFTSYATPMYNFYKNIPTFESENKTKLLVYDFINFTSVSNFKIDDMMSHSINSPKSGIWGKHIEAKRYKGSADHLCIHMNEYEHSSQSNPTHSAQSIIINSFHENQDALLKKVFRNSRADYAMTGWLMEDSVGFTLLLKIIKTGENTSETISLPLENLRDIIVSPCRQTILLELLDIDKMDSAQIPDFLADLDSYFEGCDHAVSPVEFELIANIASEAILRLKTNKNKNDHRELIFMICQKISNYKGSIGLINSTKPFFKAIREVFPDITEESCKDSSDPTPPTPNLVQEIYEKMDSIIRKSKATLLTVSLEDDTISLDATFPKNKDSLRPTSKYRRVLKQLKACYLPELDCFGEGYTCILDGPGVNNKKLSEKRIEWLLTGIDPSFEEKGYGIGPTIKFNPTVYSKNRVATIKLFMKGGQEPGQISLNY